MLFLSLSCQSEGSTEFLFIYLFHLQKKAQFQFIANKVNKTFVQLN